MVRFTRPSPCILQAIKNWSRGRPGNEATHTHARIHVQNVLAGALFEVWWGVPLVCILEPLAATCCPGHLGDALWRPTSATELFLSDKG